MTYSNNGSYLAKTYKICISMGYHDKKIDLFMKCGKSIRIEYKSEIQKTICDLLQEKGPSNFAFPTAFRRSQLSLTEFQRF